MGMANRMLWPSLSGKCRLQVLRRFVLLRMLRFKLLSWRYGPLFCKTSPSSSSPLVSLYLGEPSTSLGSRTPSALFSTPYLSIVEQSVTKVGSHFFGAAMTSMHQFLISNMFL